MPGGSEEISNWQDIWDYGARGDGLQGDAFAINAAIAAAVARNGNGGRVLIRPSTRAYMLEAPIILLDGVELLLAGGAQLQVIPGLDIDAIYGASISLARVHGSGTIIGTYDFTKSHQGIHLAFCSLCSIEGVHIAGMAQSGLWIEGGSDHKISRVTSASNGSSGIHLSSGTTRNHIDSPTTYNNGQGAAGGDGIFLDGASVHNTIVNPACFDGSGPYPTLQGYPIREGAASGCDFNLIAGLQATGNVTSNSPLLSGTGSVWTDSLTRKVGASAKSLLNYVTLDPPVQTVVNNPTTGAATTVAVTGLPASAVRADIVANLQYTGSNASTIGELAFVLSSVVYIDWQDLIDGKVVPIVSGSVSVFSAGNLRYYVVAPAGVTPSTLNIWLKGYWEPA